MNIKQLREKRARAIEQAKAVLTAVETEGRSMNEEEQRKWDGFMDEADSIKATIDRAERMKEEERSLNESQGRIINGSASASPSVEDALRGWILGGDASARQLDAANRFGIANRSSVVFNMAQTPLRAGEDVRSWENRDGQMTTPGAVGGHLVAGDFRRELEVARLQYGGLLQVIRTIRTATGAEMPWPTSNQTGRKGRRLSGEGSSADREDMAFGRVLFGAHTYTSDYVLVSNELLQDSAFPLAGHIGETLGECLGRILAEEFAINTGAGPQGLVPAVPVGHEAAAIAYDDVVDLIHSVDPAYRSRARFILNDSTLRELKKIKDSEGNPLWVPSMRDGEPDKLAGFSYTIVQEVPSIAAGARPLLFGDFQKYVNREVRDIELKRLDETFALSNQTAFVAFMRADARLVDAGTGPIKALEIEA